MKTAWYMAIFMAWIGFLISCSKSPISPPDPPDPVVPETADSVTYLFHSSTQSAALTLIDGVATDGISDDDKDRFFSKKLMYFKPKEVLVTTDSIFIQRDLWTDGFKIAKQDADGDIFIHTADEGSKRIASITSENNLTLYATFTHHMSTLHTLSSLSSHQDYGELDVDKADPAFGDGTAFYGVVLKLKFTK